MHEKTTDTHVLTKQNTQIFCFTACTKDTSTCSPLVVRTIGRYCLSQIKRTTDLPRHILNFFTTLIYFQLLKHYLQTNLRISLLYETYSNLPIFIFLLQALYFTLMVLTLRFYFFWYLLFLKTGFFQQKYVLPQCLLQQHVTEYLAH